MYELFVRKLLFDFPFNSSAIDIGFKCDYSNAWRCSVGSAVVQITTSLFQSNVAAGETNRTAAVLSARRVTDLKSPPPVSLKRLREGHKNFDVYPRDKKKPILSARWNKAPPFSRPLGICVRASADSASPQKAGEEQPAYSFTDVTRISSNSEGGSGARGTLKDRGRSAYASLSPEIHAKPGKRHAIPRRNAMPAVKFSGI